MKSSILGLLAGISIVWFAIDQTSDDAAQYFNFLSILIVFGGTISAAIITHGLKKNFDILKMFFKAFQSSKYDEVGIIKELVSISERLFRGEDVEAIKDEDIHPYVKDGLRLIHNKFSDEKIKKISTTMLNERMRHYQQLSDQLTVLAKYPPAFGMMGTIIGLIAVMKQMGGDNSIDQVGPSMAVALITTLYGIFISNYIINPISDNLSARSAKDIKVRRIIWEGIFLLNKAENPVFVREVLAGYLLPAQRQELEGEMKTFNTQRMAA